jgi:hypothetical protein
MARQYRAAFVLGASVIAVWGVALINAISGLATAPLDAAFETGPIRDYIEYGELWMVFRAFFSTIGIIAGILVATGRRAGHWLSILVAAVVLAFGVDFGWYSYFAAGHPMTHPLEFFFLMHPGLGYGVIVFPVLIALCLVASGVALARGSSLRSRVARAI